MPTGTSSPDQGNDFTGHEINPPDRAMSPTVQRSSNNDQAGTTRASVDPALREYYDAMMATPTFRELDKVVNSATPVSVVDDPSWSYNMRTHTVQVPLATPDGEPRPAINVRSRILFEMHNARRRGPALRSRAKILKNLSDEANYGALTETEKRLLPYRKAAAALSGEWDEWCAAAEHDARATKMNAEAQRDLVKRFAPPSFDVPDQGWFLFENCLKEQVEEGHTGSTYDIDASRLKQNWPGWKILRQAAISSPASLKITQKEYKDFQEGLRKTIKSPSNNPFNSNAIVVRAAGDER